MLRMVACTSAAGVKGYFFGGGGASLEEYYSPARDEIVGVWGGRGAEWLGLVGNVVPTAFGRLCDNVHPHRPDQPLTPRTKESRRVGYDINFHCPKSVSILHAMTSDERIRVAFERAVDETMRRLESEVATRVRVAGAQEDRVTGNLTWGRFVHLTSRPVKGIPDPHLHAHVFVMNATFDVTESRWKAIQLGDVKRDARFFEACFHASLSSSLRELGYGIERTAKSWEIAGISRSLIERFSRRTAVIEEAAMRRGINNPNAKAELGAKTRERKRDSLPDAEVRADWEGRLTPEDRQALKDARRGHPTERISPALAVEKALASLMERSSVVKERALATEALRFGMGSCVADGVLRALEERPLLRHGSGRERIATTKEAIEEERAFVKQARDGRGRHAPLASRMTPSESSSLSPAQRVAAEHVWNSHDWVTVVRGAAGTGKTTMMKETVEGLRRAGHSVSVFAPTAEAARGVLRREGFDGAETVAKLLHDSAVKTAVRGHVLWVDEAGLLGVQDAVKLFDIAQSQGSRLILSGDTKQHAAVVRGDAMRLLETKAGCPVAELTEIRRQTGAYRDAVRAIADGRVADGFARLDALGAIREGPPETRHAQIAEEVVLGKSERKTTLVVSPTHAEGRAVTESIRGRLKHLGLLTDERHLTRLESLNRTEAERTAPSLYRVGEIACFNKNAPGFWSGDRCEIVSVANAGVFVRTPSGGERPLPLHLPTRFDVFERKPIDVAAGDTLRVTKSCTTADGAHRLENGSFCDVKSFAPDGNLVLTNGWTLSRDVAHITHGYCVTSYGAQGKTVDRAFIAQGSESFCASSSEQFYVSVSRAREQVLVFTDDKPSLLRRVEESSARMAALDIHELQARLRSHQESREIRPPVGREAEPHQRSP